jgi:Co/Zn/Cd efflux system component
LFLIEDVARFSAPPVNRGGPMLAVAIGGLVSLVSA